MAAEQLPTPVIMVKVEPMVKAAAVEAKPFDVDVFRQDRRIHVKDGSIFTQDHYIVVHPAELDPKNEPRLTAKLIKHYTIPSPNYFAYAPRGPVALQMASLLPISVQSKQQLVAAQMLDLYQQGKTGEDRDFAADVAKREAPFDALVRAYLENPNTNPMAMEYTQNAMAIYLLLNEALRKKGYNDEAAAYLRRGGSPEVILAQLEPKLGISAREFSDIAAKEGLAGLAKKLDVPAHVLGEIRQIVAISASNQFSDNMVQNWNVGRSINGMETRPMVEKIQAGLMVRVAGLMEGMRKSIPQRDVPPDVAKTEKMIVATLRDLPPELAEALYVSGTEFAYTPDPSIGSLDVQAGRALGFYRPATYDEGNENGVRQIFVSARQSTQEFRENLMHESHHMFFPRRFSVEQREKIDGLLADGVKHMQALKGMLDQWFEASPADREAIKAQIDAQFCKPKGTTLDQLLGPVSMNSLRDAVHDAVDNLNPHSPYLTKAAYQTPELRVAEIISRYAEMKYVRRKDVPAVLDFIAPQMTAIYNDFYLPHIREQLADMKSKQTQLPEHLRNLGLPPMAITGQAAPTFAIPKPEATNGATHQVSHLSSEAPEVIMSRDPLAGAARFAGQFQPAGNFASLVNKPDGVMSEQTR